MNISEFKAGGKVSVTLKDGTKVIDSPIEGGNYLQFANNNLTLRDSMGKLGPSIASVDSYTPPKPEWDRPEVVALIDADDPIVKALRETNSGVPNEKHWAVHGPVSQRYCTTDFLIASGRNWRVFGVTP